MALQVPDWLDQLAARDDPPTVIDEAMLAHFEWVGVEAFTPVIGKEMCPEDEGLRATAVGVRVPGIGVADSFEDEVAPVAAALDRLLTFLDRFDRLRRVRLAAIDMCLVEETASALLRGREGRLFERVLETGLVVTYARPSSTPTSQAASAVAGYPRAGPTMFGLWEPDATKHLRVYDVGAADEVLASDRLVETANLADTLARMFGERMIELGATRLSGFGGPAAARHDGS